MTTTTPPVTAVPPPPGTVSTSARTVRKRLSNPYASVAAIVIAVLWTVPTFGLAVTSLRPQLAIRKTGWWTFFSDPTVTLDNYKQVLTSDSSASLGGFFINSFVIVIPAVVIPICLATLAAYAFAWIDFPFRNILFVGVFALQIVPIQVTLLPLLTLYVKLGIAGTFWTVWLSHTVFALPLAIFLLHNFMREIPRELLEAARVDGAGHVTIFFRVLLPLLTPALAAFGIFQFLWVWNDLLVSLTFLGSNDTNPLTVALYNLSGTRGTAWYLLSAGAFVSIIIPLVVFVSLQRFFVRGLLAGGLKG
jgi:alpha-glucoside transport system permease protein